MLAIGVLLQKRSTNTGSYRLRQLSGGSPLVKRSWRVFDVNGPVESTNQEPYDNTAKTGDLVSGGSPILRVAREAFLPVGFPETVSAKYIEYIRYNMIQVTFISMSRVLATQAMLFAVGLGQGSALPIAAVMNWLLKDGLGHVGSIVVGTRINTKFDSDPKRYKFLSVSLGQLANLLGILSLAKPGMFLLLTSLSSALSRVGTLAITSSRARIYANFSLAGNLGDLMRCSQAQSTLATLMGTALGVITSPLVGADIQSILSVFCPVTVLTHIYAYKAVAVIELRTLNRQRLELIVSDWMRNKVVPSVASVASHEKFIASKRIFPVHVNPDISADLVNQDFIEKMADQGFCVHVSGSKVSVNFREGISPETAAKGFTEACFVASEILSKTSGRNLIAFEWDSFWKELGDAGWDTSVTFIDRVEKRVRLEKNY